MKAMLVIHLLLFFYACERDRFDKNEIPKSNIIVDEQELAVLKGENRATYIPIYSNILYHDENLQIALHSTVSIRNLSVTKGLKVNSATYYDSNGKKIRELSETAFAIRPFATHEITILEGDLKGGAGAKIVVQWESLGSEFPVPMIEAIFMGKRGSSEFAFTSRGISLSEIPK